MQPVIGMTMLYKGEKVVHITGGSYMGSHGVSNFWNFREVRKDGSLGKPGGDYDNAPGKFMQIENASIRIVVPKKPQVLGLQSDWDANPHLQQ